MGYFRSGLVACSFGYGPASEGEHFLEIPVSGEDRNCLRDFSAEVVRSFHSVGSASPPWNLFGMFEERRGNLSDVERAYF